MSPDETPLARCSRRGPSGPSPFRALDTLGQNVEHSRGFAVNFPVRAIKVRAIKGRRYSPQFSLVRPLRIGRAGSFIHILPYAQTDSISNPVPNAVPTSKNSAGEALES